MVKKPSEMSNREAHDALREKVVKWLIKQRDFTMADSIKLSPMFDFPPDPPERVSDDDLNMVASMGDEARPMVRRMALELIERRAKDKEQGR